MSLPQSPGSLHAIVEQLAKDHSDRPAVDGLDGDPWSYNKLYASSLRMASVLRSRLAGCTKATQAGYSLSIGLCAPRGPRWVAVCVAASMLGVPFVPMVQDLHPNTKSEAEAKKIRDTTDDRNRAIMRDIQPMVVVVDDATTPKETIKLVTSFGQCTVVDINSLLTEATCSFSKAVEPLQPVQRESPLCLLFTGGTTKASKCAVVSQGMLAHEFKSYPLIVPDSQRGILMGGDGPRVLQQSSSYWGATCIGQLSLSLALQGCLVMVDVSSQRSLSVGISSTMDLRSMITNFAINVVGAVPSQLAATTLDDDVAKSMLAVFTWGEKLTTTIGDEWSSKIPIVIELLVATEYWLSMYRLVTPYPTAGPVFTVVPGVRVTTLSEDEATTDITKGELILAGPSVTETGYVEQAENECLFVKVDDRRFFRTNDLIEVIEWRAESEGCAETLRYLGRSDMFIKLGGQWVDLEVLQEKISTLPCVKEVVLLQQQPKVLEAARGTEGTLGGLKLEDNTEQPSVHAFIIMKPFRMAPMAEVQRLLPSGNVVQVHWLALQTLPRHTATGKVDRRALLGMVSDGDLPSPSDVELKRCRGYLARWSLITAIIAVIHYLVLGLSGMFLAAHFNITYWTLKMVHGNIWRILEHAKPPYIADEPGLRWVLRSVLDWSFSVVRMIASQLKDLEISIKSRACSIGGILVSFSFTLMLTLAMGLLSDSVVWSVAWQSAILVTSGLLLDSAFPPLDGPYRSQPLWYRACHGLVLVVQFNLLWWLSIGRSIEKDSGKVAEWTRDPGAPWWMSSWLRDCSLDMDQTTSALRGYSLQKTDAQEEDFLMDSVFVSPRDLRHCRDHDEVFEGMFDQRSGWTTTADKADDGYQESYYYSWMDTQQPTDGRRHRGLPPTVQITNKEWSEMRKDAVDNIERWLQEGELETFDEDVIDGESYHMAKENLGYEERRHLGGTAQSTPMAQQQLEVSETSTTPTLGARDDDDDSSTDSGDDEWYVSGNDAPTSTVTDEIEAPALKRSKVGGGTESLAQRLALLVEKQLSYPIDDYDAEVVSSIDSLGAVQLAHSIRTELRLTGLLSVGDVLKCRTINDLVAVVDSKSKTVEDTIGSKSDDMSSDSFTRLSKVLDALTGVDPRGHGPKSAAGLPVQVWGWQGVCAWMLEWTKGNEDDDDDIDLVALQMAVQAVVARQASMRVVTDVGIGYFTFMNECLSVQGLVKYMALTRGGRWLSWIADVAYGIGRWVLWPLWGRIHLSSAVEGRPGAVRVREFTSRDTLRRWIQSEKRQNFHSPLAMDIVLLDESYDGCGPVRTFVRVFVTHAFSDGFSVVPLLSDLNEAYASAKRGRHRGPRHRLLPPLRTSGPQVQSGRLRHTLFDRARDVHGDTLYPCYTIDHTTVSHYSNGFGHCVKLLPSVHLTLHSISRKLGAPVDVVMLAAIVLASVRERGWRKVAKATLVVPLRDGPSEHQLVGLFADLRNVDIPLEDIIGDDDARKPCASSVLNFVLTLRHMIKFRRWTIPTPLSSCERMLVNLLPAQFPSGGEGRFEQNLHVSPLPQGSSVTATRAMEIACDQTSRDSWALRFKCREPDYSREDLCNWLEYFQGAIRDMVVDPMRPLYH